MKRQRVNEQSGMRRAIVGRAPPARILILKPSSLGDIVHALPVLRALRLGLPRAHIAWLVSSSFAPLLRHHPHLDEVLVFDRRRYGRLWRSGGALRGFAQFLSTLRKGRFDCVIDLQGLFRSAFLASASGAPLRLGFAEAREGAPLFYSHRVRAPRELHAVERNLRLAGALGLSTAPEFDLALTADEHARASAALSERGVDAAGGFIAVLPGARWESKRWPEASFAQLNDTLQACGAPPRVLLGGGDERVMGERIVAQSQAPLANLIGCSDLRVLCALLARSAVVVTADSGPMHIAAALSRPIVALFGPTSAVRTGPYSQTATVLTHPQPCAPCLRRVCPLRHQNCLRQLEPRRVADAVLTWLRVSR